MQNKEYREPERFVQVKYPGKEYYRISNYGTVINTKTGKVLTQSHKRGIDTDYAHCLGKYIHRMVYEHFVGEIPEGNDIHHINGKKYDNYYKNLQALPKAEHAKKQISRKPMVRRPIIIEDLYTGELKKFDNMKSASLYCGQHSGWITENINTYGKRNLANSKYRVWTDR